MSRDGTGEGRCFYCGATIEYGGQTKIITTTGTNEFECWECHNCKRRYLIEPMGEDEDE